MGSEQVDRNSNKDAGKYLLRRVVDRLPSKVTTAVWRSSHFWVIAAIILLETFIYYVDQSPWTTLPPFDNPFFYSIHDLHRLLFLIPIVYAALVFRVRGSAISSFILLCVVLPRGILYSPYPDPLLRAVIFVVAAGLVGLLVAFQLDRTEREEKARIQLDAAYRQLKESQEQLIQAEKLSSLGQLAASIAHEVNNPISGTLVYNQLLIKNIKAKKLTDEKALDYLATMESELTRCGRLVGNLHDFARQRTPELESVDINELLERSLNLVAHAATLHHVEVVKNYSPSISEVTADPNQLQQVFTNLMLNAIQAMPQGGTMTLSTSETGGEVRADVKDAGVGISKENMQKLFTPFFTTKKEIKGVGLGLAVSYGIIKQHKGRIEVNSEEGKGSTFTVFLNV